MNLCGQGKKCSAQLSLEYVLIPSTGTQTGPSRALGISGGGVVGWWLPRGKPILEYSAMDTKKAERTNFPSKSSCECVLYPFTTG